MGRARPHKAAGLVRRSPRLCSRATFLPRHPTAAPMSLRPRLPKAGPFLRLRPFLLTLAGLLLIAASVMPAWAQQYKPEYKLSTAVGPAYPWGRGAVIWAQLIKDRTAG